MGEKKVELQVSQNSFRHRVVFYIKSGAQKVGKVLRAWLLQPDGLPTYCFEYAPDC